MLPPTEAVITRSVATRDLLLPFRVPHPSFLRVRLFHAGRGTVPSPPAEVVVAPACPEAGEGRLYPGICEYV